MGYLLSDKLKTITLFLGVALFTNTNAQLVAKYTFTNSNANNEASSGNNGTVTGATLATDRFGNTNKAYAFDGTTSQRIDFGDVTAFNNASQYTISMWLNQTQLDVIGAFWSKSRLCQIFWRFFNTHFSRCCIRYFGTN